MEPTQLVDDREPAPFRVGGRRRKAAPVLRLRAAKVKSTAFLGALTGLLVVVVLREWLGQPPAAVVVISVFALVGGVVGSKRRDDTCVSCESSLPVEVDRCVRCDAPIGGEITNLSQRVDAEEAMRKQRVAARKQAEAAGKKWEEDDDEEDGAPPSSL
jgi:hypothetical protein